MKQPTKRSAKPMAPTKASTTSKPVKTSPPPSPAYDLEGSDHRDPALRDTAGPRSMAGASLVVAVALVAILGFGLWISSSIQAPPPDGSNAVETGSTTQAQPGTSPEQQPAPDQGTSQQ